MTAAWVNGGTWRKPWTPAANRIGGLRRFIPERCTCNASPIGFLVHRTPSADRVATGCATRGIRLTADMSRLMGQPHKPRCRVCAADGETCFGRLDSNSLGVGY